MNEQGGGINAGNIGEQIGGLNANIKAIFKRLDDQQRLTESVYRLTASVEVLANGQKGLAESIKALRSDVDDIKMRPVKRWEVFVGALITLGAGMLLGKFGI